MHTFFGIIPARSGSKRIKNKNLIPLGEKPLIQYTFDAGANSKKLDLVILSSDNPFIIDLAKRKGVKAPFVRPSHLARDDSLMVEVIQHALDWYNGHFGRQPIYFVLLSPTSPFRNADDIDRACEKIQNSGKDSLVSVCPVTQHPAECFTVGNDGKLEFITISGMDLLHGTQNYKPSYFIDGAIYICKTSAFFERFRQKGLLFDGESDYVVMPKSHAIDINDMFDLNLARAMIHFDRQGSKSFFLE